MGAPSTNMSMARSLRVTMLFAAVLVFTAHGESAPPVPDYDGVVPENRPLDKHSTAELIQELLRRPLDKLKTADLIGKLHGQPAAPASELIQMDHGNIGGGIIHTAPVSTRQILVKLRSMVC